jgi:hypothetical protein
VYRPKLLHQGIVDPKSIQVEPVIQPSGPVTSLAVAPLLSSIGLLAKEAFSSVHSGKFNKLHPVQEEIVSGDGQQWKNLSEVEPAHRALSMNHKHLVMEAENGEKGDHVQAKRKRRHAENHSSDVGSSAVAVGQPRRTQ